MTSERTPQQLEGEEAKGETTDEIDDAEEHRRDEMPPPGNQARHKDTPQQCADQKTSKEHHYLFEIKRNSPCCHQCGKDAEPEHDREWISQREGCAQSKISTHVRNLRLVSSSSIGISERLPREPQQEQHTRSAQNHAGECVLHE